MRVLVIEDYEPIRTAVAQGLSEAAFAVDTAANGTDGLWYAQSNDYDVILLDLMLPDVDGLKILRQLRSSGSQSRILILTAKDAVEDRIEGLNSGADDYVLKPFVFEELLARVQVLVRRRYDFSDPVIRVSDLVIDTAAQTVERGGRSIELTKREYSLLVFLAMRRASRITDRDLGEPVRIDSDAHSNVVDVYIRYLRKKLEHPDMPKLIHTRGFGYVLSLEGADA
ncbi:MAG: response regulator transcription factor [Planctomycetaceae bacterium]